MINRSFRLPLLLVFASFLAYAAVRAPVPGVNEPHYLCKAKHYWNPQWCAGDLFLESSDAHLVFYQTVGLLTRVFSLKETAWIGRIASLLLAAAGWTALASRLAPGRWTSLWGAWAFLGLQATGNLSGEWVIGGVESKVFAYGFLFLAWALGLDRRWNLAAVLAGLSISFHPVVGVWGVAAAVFAFTVNSIFTDRALIGSLFGRANALRIAGPLAVLVLCSLPGLMPALAVVRNGSSWQADYIQVFYRLPHHLDPMVFSPWAYLSYAMMLAAWLWLRWHAGFKPCERLFFWIVVGSLLIAAAGWVVGAGPRPPSQMPLVELRIKLMKFYPFRLFDVLLPMAMALSLAAAVRRWIEPYVREGAGRQPPLRLLASTLFASLFVWALALPAADRNPSRLPSRQLADWQAACRWIAAETPRDSLFFTPGESWAFKWYAERPEFVSRKDCPQDAAGIIEWNRRLRLIADWSRRWFHPQQGYSAEAVEWLHAETGMTHIIASDVGPFPMPPVYANGSYKIYRVAEAR